MVLIHVFNVMTKLTYFFNESDCLSLCISFRQQVDNGRQRIEDGGHKPDIPS